MLSVLRLKEMGNFFGYGLWRLVIGLSFALTHIPG
ncbi:hypothetical protein UC8_45230 [Roseimaritima ulvae]|uniref:Uncharacterized protein n=1 Tax=Roseimaritima ulvae TaxID=980254 RepID=A0A5B9QTZ2_9BACT|nr:hypothetical protein UC8_45230 [Roseimaritima ulvae]